MSALFLLLVLSAAAAFMLNLSGVQRSTVNLAIQGAHALQATRSGVEWGIWQLATNGTCFAATNLSLSEGGFSGFTVAVTCTSTDHTEATTNSSVYQIVSIAEQGAYGDPDYARRRLRVTISDAP
jgi:MSHA biogenesis protein MshP